jgi:Arc/MetJ family transcription regulator
MGRGAARGDGPLICHTDAIRTTLDIDDNLMATLLARLPGRSKTDAIELAIEGFLASDSIERLKGLAGTMEINDLSGEFRRVDRAT